MPCIACHVVYRYIGLRSLLFQHNEHNKRAGRSSEQVRAAIVTCGGLCPGLNNVIRELVNSLFHLYKVQTVYGIR